MLARNWKHQWLLLCPAKLLREIRIVGVVHPIKSKQNLRVFWKPVNPQDCVWENLYQNIMRTTLQVKETIRCSTIKLVHKFVPMLQAMKIPAAEAAVDKEWEKLQKIPAWDITKVRSKSDVIDDARTKGRKIHFASLMEHLSFEECRIGDKAPKIQRSSCTPRRYCER